MQDTTRVESEYLDARQLAAKLGVAVKTVRKWAYLRRIPGAVRFGGRCVRFRAVEVERALSTGSFFLPK
jgi:predicted DNA-binding transcriptional regulator AlpA